MRYLWRDIHTRKLLVLFVFVVIIFTLLAARLEVQQNDLEKQQRSIISNANAIESERRQSAIEGCTGGQAVLQQFNTYQRNLIRVQEENIAADPEPELTKARERLIEIYKKAILPLPNCSALPSP